MNRLEIIYQEKQKEFESHIRGDILELVKRGEIISPKEWKELSDNGLNSYERKALWPILPLQERLAIIQSHLENCSREFSRAGEFELIYKYDEWMKREGVHLLIAMVEQYRTFINNLKKQLDFK